MKLVSKTIITAILYKILDFGNKMDKQILVGKVLKKEEKYIFNSEFVCNCKP